MTPSVALRRPLRRDVVIAVVCWSVAVGLLLLVRTVSGLDPELADDVAGLSTTTWWATALTVSGQAVALLWARVAPRAILLVVATIPLIVSWTTAGTLLSLTSVAVAVASYVAFVERPLDAARAVGLAVVAMTFVAFAVAGLREDELGAGAVLAGSLAQAALVVGVPALVALLVSSRRDIREAREHELRAVERENEARVREARAHERTAMARELHDIAAHHLSGITVMAAAIERQIGTDPEGARDGARQVRGQSAAVLRDLRRLVGLLREDDVAELSVEALHGIAELTGRISQHGTPVGLTTLRDEGGRPLGSGLGPLAQLTAYRMVQEALANAVQHAPGARCLVTMDDRDPSSLLVTVRNEAAATAPTSRGSGLGLVGMRERAELTGADLRYGPTTDGGWDVSLRLPRDPTAGDDR
ncbi:sensor histidine kinase [Actinotalea sp. K2]|uniref:sensor histidine kinase n=1 Tax=Actinotalea sp. K2 TaxID=2939438 RepID=UPI002016E88E|nr:histidine kinase [Actinotalea sp. K2]MCL3862344.1 histidine kinase [Actinotalea sp. K2]